MECSGKAMSHDEIRNERPLARNGKAYVFKADDHCNKYYGQVYSMVSLYQAVGQSTSLCGCLLTLCVNGPLQVLFAECFE